MSGEAMPVQGSLGTAEGKGVVRIEARLDAGVDRVWAALTEPGHLERWYGEVEGELRPGGAFHARLHASGWEGTRTIRVCEPARRLLVAADDLATPGADSTEVTLAPDGERTLLVVEQRGLPVDLLWAYGAGLQIHVEDLAAHLAGRDRTDARTRFGALEAQYRALAEELP